MVTNPFIIAGVIPSECFCDRVTETENLTKYLVNGNNVVLISPRRMGKSALISHCFQKSEFKDYATIYIDILQTTSLNELVYLLGKEIYNKIVPKTKKWTSKFIQTLKSIVGFWGIDPMSGFPSFNLSIGQIENPMLTLEEIFTFIENYDKKCIIAVDEFQQIEKYKEKNVEAILRSQIQKSSNVNFIFSGSESHMMQEIFLSHARPFYQSATIMILDKIPEAVYIEFARQQFAAYEKSVTEDGVRWLYNLFEGCTYYLQKVLNSAFSNLMDGGVCDKEKIKQSIRAILEENALPYRVFLSNMSESQKKLLYAIALEQNAEGITSGEFIRKYRLLSPSSVQSATRALLDKECISKVGNTYSVNDKFFALWIRWLYGPSDSNFD